MLVNITGVKKVIPGVGKLPPVKNYDATEAEIRRLVNFNDWQVYEASSGRLITKSNVDKILYGNSGSSGGSSSGGSSSGGGSTTTDGGVNWKFVV